MREISHASYAWKKQHLIREQNSNISSSKKTAQALAFLKNPRVPDSLSFELPQYAFSAYEWIGLHNHQQQTKKGDEFIVHELFLQASLLPLLTPLQDEINYLVHANILTLSEGKGIEFHKDWIFNATAEMLDDMHDNFGYDPLNRYCVHDFIRSSMLEFWTRDDEGVWYYSFTATNKKPKKRVLDSRASSQEKRFFENHQGAEAKSFGIHNFNVM
jgi:hypothetical protein